MLADELYEVFKDIKKFWTVYSRPFIRYQGKNLHLFWIWCCFQFLLHYFMQPNRWNANGLELFPWCLTFSEFIVSVSNRLKFILNHHYSESVSNKNLALYWRQNSCPGTTLIFFVFSCWTIWRLITCSRLTLRQSFINTAQHLLSLLSKTLPNTFTWCSKRSFHSPSHLKVLLSTKTRLAHLFQSHIQIPNSPVSGEMLQVAFSFQDFVNVTYIRHFFNFKCVLQMFI